ncbi:MAG: hypothetical protein D6687_08440 [Acidobacteria bacterium]|jgi:uncharacterized damage-inducible protein DinB|nr:MAG: hypothetical protein D6687_08440 [Acidobacteriota bacterium]GIU82162.1 MAG: hypothetical protein KatS3mg006_1226 [Pyrinomonadaceae bacterium]
MSNLAKSFVSELKHEAETTRKVLERVAEEKFDWRPHEKSMTMGRLAGHIAEMIGWIEHVFKGDELDLGKGDRKPFEPKTSAELLEVFKKNLQGALETLEKASDEEMIKTWTLRNGETVLLSLPKVQVLRAVIFNHIIHHRGQLSVYLRMNDIPVPSIYGPSADER